jgi:hypothetical protein
MRFLEQSPRHDRPSPYGDLSQTKCDELFGSVVGRSGVLRRLTLG